MEERGFGSAHSMMEAALSEAAGGARVLTPTSRLAKRYRHARRMASARSGAPTSWETPEILGFARFVRAQYESLWEPRAVLPKAGQLRFWAQAFQETDLPAEFREGIVPTPALFAKLQQTYDLLCRKGAERSGRAEGISGWRGRLVQRFEARVRENGYRCWDEVVRTVGRALESGTLPRPRRVVVLLREDPEALERELFAALEKAGSEVALWRLHGEAPSAPCRVYATPEQECRAACHEARLAWNASGGREYLGLVALDPAYFPLLLRALEELSGRAQAPEGSGRFNVAWGPSLTDHPLFLVATLPLQLGTSEAPAPLLASLLSSPLCNGARHGFSATGVREALWPEERALDAGSALAELGRRGSRGKALAGALAPFVRGGARPLGDWIGDLRAAWGALGFPFWGVGVSEPVRDAQANAWEGLTRSLDEVHRLAGDLSMGPAQALEWLRTTAENRQVVAPGAESGGLQVLSPQEAFGIPFDRLWVVGGHGGVLPAPRPAEPLLTPEEVVLLDGSPAERCWQRALQTLATLGASARGDARWSRALAAADGNPYLASPLLREEAGGALPFDVWGERASSWTAAPWLAGTLRGLARPVPATALPAEALPAAAPTEVRVTRLGRYLRCPFQYFAEERLGLAPLPEPPQGVSPLKRGEVVHAIAQEFMRTLPGAVPEWPEDGGAAWAHLRAVADAQLAAQGASCEWRAERRWLVGEDDEGSLGVLRAWLEAERDHRRCGWRPLEGALEVTFEGLQLGDAPVRLRGTIDRVDEHPELGRWVLDYKSGTAPGGTAVLKDRVEPQLLAYCAAVARDLITPQERRAPFEGPLAAAYVPLRRRAEVVIEPLRYYSKVLDRGAVREWEEEVLTELRALGEGRFPAAPRPKGERTTRKNRPCVTCALQALCGFFDDPERALAEGEGDGEGGP